MTGNGKYRISQFKSSGSSAMVSKAKRWTKTVRDKLISSIPGPGRYEVPYEIGACMNSSISKFQSVQSQPFAKTNRDKLLSIACCITL